MAEFDPLKNYSERYNDPGAPYFYKAKVPKAGNPLRNSLLGKAIALNVRYPFHLVKGWGQLIGNIKKPSGTNNNIRTLDLRVPSIDKPKLGTFDFTGKKGSEDVTKVVDMRQKISIILADEAEVVANGGEPYIRLDFIPRDLNFDVKSSLKDIGIIGINYPHYHYQGSHETLSFTIDWYDYPTHRDRLITKCKKVEALSKADGFKSGPPRIIIGWGDKMFKGNIFIVESANYTVKDFLLGRSTSFGAIQSLPTRNINDPLGTGSSFTQASTTPSRNVRAYNNHLQPLHATQKVILKRIASHLTHKQIIDGTV